ncbi:hypothetical protein JIN77_02830 [Verrucomicrobiaceae bacterium R5-34]|uniref:Uncharacterized protein n=1 Tax=Oceaniferula flava TaxID=2800421 RepID=A0AAE2SAH8_9BACT|nr:hypothetical protein [Oceaniferula flavus]MBK1829647.1 hypothetical protein [Verrucomicrobiaceae bacterium R5-34]MBK1853837.1 hypothetical protein [Oceaniferula flavus]MBM1135143.1 hypothetical protein [Oceaniferula flavus]
MSFAREGAEISNDLVPVDVLGDFSLVASDEEWEAGYQDLLYRIQAVA